MHEILSRPASLVFLLTSFAVFSLESSLAAAAAGTDALAKVAAAAGALGCKNRFVENYDCKSFVLTSFLLTLVAEPPPVALRALAPVSPHAVSSVLAAAAAGGAGRRLLGAAGRKEVYETY